MAFIDKTKLLTSTFVHPEIAKACVELSDEQQGGWSRRCFGGWSSPHMCLSKKMDNYPIADSERDLSITNWDSNNYCSGYCNWGFVWKCWSQAQRIAIEQRAWNSGVLDQHNGWICNLQHTPHVPSVSPFPYLNHLKSIFPESVWAQGSSNSGGL